MPNSHNVKKAFSSGLKEKTMHSLEYRLCRRQPWQNGHELNRLPKRTDRLRNNIGVHLSMNSTNIMIQQPIIFEDCDKVTGFKTCSLLGNVSYLEMDEKRMKKER